MPILQDAMQQGAPAQQPQGQPQGQGGPSLPKPNPEIMSPIVQDHMDELEKMREGLTGKTGDAYDRVLTAGMKMLYSPQNADVLKKLILDEDVPMPNKLGEGIANLLVMMDNQGNGTIPKEVLVPVGVALMMEAVDYLFECGIDVTEDDLGKGLELLIDGVFVGYGIDPAKMEQVIDDMGQKLGFKEQSPENEKAEATAEAGENETPAEDTAEGPAGEQAEEAGFNKGFKDEQAARAM